MNVGSEEQFIPPPLELTAASATATGGFPSLKMFKVRWDEIVKAIPHFVDRSRPTSVEVVAELNLHLFKDYRYGHALWKRKGLSNMVFAKERKFGKQAMDRLYALVQRGTDQAVTGLP